ncbi:DUF4350 domain-containing protein [Stutzerimonas azotifigens]|uniref:DUF4350 domain-containing protein n=1 Tax=Stutzerimonas azotifigens TaxID=291995 RepID=UPI000420A7C7|nr:DUF4350 domain-containing protein [Stutzerimonas azotifigens]
MRRDLWLGLLALATLAGLLLFLLGRLQPYEQQVDHGPAPEARQNPYLAAERFLAGLQTSVERHPDLLLPEQADGHTLLLLGERDGLGPARTEQVLDWVRRGGRLVFVAERLWDERQGHSGDLLLDRLGIQQFESSDEGDTAGPPEDATNKPERYPELARFYRQGEQLPAYLAFDTGFHLYDANGRAHAWANSANATHLLQLRHGQGVITVLTDAWIWRNDQIGDYDHAWLLGYLTRGTAVSLVHRIDRESLLSLLLEHFPQALAAASLALLLLLWHLAQRRGPVHPPAPAARRQLFEHLRGSADFLFRRGAQQRLIETLQRDIAQCARRHHPGFERLPADARLEALTRLSRLPATSVGQAMRPPGAKPLGMVEFTRQVAQLQTLRNAL